MKNYHYQYEYRKDHTGAIAGKVGDIQEKTSLINDHMHKRRSKSSIFCSIILVFLLVILVLTVTACFIIEWQITSASQLPSGSVDLQTLRLMAEETSVLLANYSIRKHQQGGTVTITEKILEEDYFHVNKFVAVPSAMIRIHRVPANDSDLVIPLSDNAIALNERYVYVLEGSVFNYTVCGGEGIMPTKSTFYAFDNEDDYNDYLNSDSLNTVVRSIFSKVIEIGGKGVLKCTTFNFTVNHTSYYFFALKTRYANTRINYSLSASFNQLSFSDYIYNYSTCNIVDSDRSSCTIQIPRHGQWSIIGYSQKNYDFNSHLNHVQLSMDQSQSNVDSVLQPVLLYSGIGLAGVCLLYTVLVMVVYCARKRHVSMIVVYD